MEQPGNKIVLQPDKVYTHAQHVYTQLKTFCRDQHPAQSLIRTEWEHNVCVCVFNCLFNVRLVSADDSGKKPAGTQS